MRHLMLTEKNKFTLVLRQGILVKRDNKVTNCEQTSGVTRQTASVNSDLKGQNN